jgi:hypothetical protein
VCRDSLVAIEELLALVHAELWACVTATTVRVLYKHTTAPGHVPEGHRRHAAGAKGVIAWAASIGPMTEAMVRRLIDANPVREMGWHPARGLQRVGEKHGPERTELACGPRPAPGSALVQAGGARARLHTIDAPRASERGLRPTRLVPNTWPPAGSLNGPAVQVHAMVRNPPSNAKATGRRPSGRRCPGQMSPPPYGTRQDPLRLAE